MTPCLDVAVIGAGPGGATAAALLAEAGHRVGLFERSEFPRFHVGESLVPAVNFTLRRLGVLDRMDACGFRRKHGVQFFAPRGAGRPFYFAETSDPLLHNTWQVRRSAFDAMLVDRARECGAEVHLGTEVFEVIRDGDVVQGLRTRGAGGVSEDVHARVVVDASGTNSPLARQLGDRTGFPDLQNTSVFAHYEGVHLDPGKDAGSTLIYRLDVRSWLWQIPLPDAVSVGLVSPADSISSFGSTPAGILDRAIAASPPLAERMKGAKRVSEVHAVRDFSYHAQRDGGPGWALVGDALGFIDPMYSTGLFLTMLSSELACERIESQLATDAPALDMQGFAGRFRTAFEQFLVLVRAFYREDFHFGAFAKDPQHRQGLVDMLTGIVQTPEAVQVISAIREQIAADPACDTSLTD